MKKWLAYIFLTIFSFQVLPVKEIGKILFKGQMTEEIHEADLADGSPSKIKKSTDPFRLHPTETEQTARIQYISHRASLAVVESERLPLQFIPDIFTPPPNVA
jgi:hypothetical protein